jgi:hypothetical protein
LALCMAAGESLAAARVCSMTVARRSRSAAVAGGPEVAGRPMSGDVPSPIPKGEGPPPRRLRRVAGDPGPGAPKIAEGAGLAAVSLRGAVNS